MTPKEKAKELFKRYYRDSDLLVEDLSCIQAKECALIAVEEILTALDEHQWQNRNVIEFYFYVKQDIQKL